MTATTEIDKSGRLVVPKKLRDALHLTPGTRLTVRREGCGLMIEPEVKPGRMFVKNGIPVFEIGHPLPPDHVNWVEQDREDRADELFNR
jgi:AbrB family looped-hinge helix DNA binding protein